jgi:hypothetical protein
MMVSVQGNIDALGEPADALGNNKLGEP